MDKHDELPEKLRESARGALGLCGADSSVFQLTNLSLSAALRIEELETKVEVLKGMLYGESRDW